MDKKQRRQKENGKRKIDAGMNCNQQQTTE